jgi:hypothetical protein
VLMLDFDCLFAIVVEMMCFSQGMKPKMDFDCCMQSMMTLDCCQSVPDFGSLLIGYSDSCFLVFVPSNRGDYLLLTCCSMWRGMGNRFVRPMYFPSLIEPGMNFQSLFPGAVFCCWVAASPEFSPCHQVYGLVVGHMYDEYRP